MKHRFIFLLLIGFPILTEGQIIKKILDKTKRKTEEKISDKISDAATRPIDKVGMPDGKSGPVDEKSSADDDEKTGTAKNEKSATSLTTYSKFDFIPGEKILVEEDFAQDAIGDFPDQWNTNATGEVVTIEDIDGHWLEIKKKGRYIPEFINDLPENFTFQFDMVCNDRFTSFSDNLRIFLLSEGDENDIMNYYFIGHYKLSGVRVDVNPTHPGRKSGEGGYEVFVDGQSKMQNTGSISNFNSYDKKNQARVSLWRQGTRLRLYVNQEKIFDIPKAFAAGKQYKHLFFELASPFQTNDDHYLINNLRLAVGLPDTRNKLIKEGKYSTTGILFDVNSDVIKPESYGVLKDLATVLKENPDIKIRIIGHTDSDGDDDFNLELSKRRAASVKSVLSAEFDISNERMKTDGMGEKQPVAENNSPEGKANNRRVEFIKV